MAVFVFPISPKGISKSIVDGKPSEMRILINIVLAILIVLEIATLLFGLMAGASGHHIPTDTTNGILITLLVLGGLIWILMYIKRLDKQVSWVEKRPR